MPHAIRVVDTGERTVLARNRIVEQAKLADAIGAAMREEYHFIHAAGLCPAGAPFVIYRNRLPDHRWDVAICAPIAEPPTVRPPAHLAAEELPATSVATTLHRGSYSTLGEAYEELAAWISRHGYRVSGPPMETHLSEPMVPREKTETIIEMPVELAAT